MDLLTSAFYGKDFEIKFLKSKGDAFQTFFEELMSRAYKADFMACRPWGNVGDKKNDGFLKSERRLFQVYAPNDLSAAEAKRKITEDFDGALKHWGVHFDKWTFVHNAIKLPPDVQQLLLDTEKANPGIKIEPWSLEELRDVFRRVDQPDLQSWFNYTPPTATEHANIGFEEIRIVLEDIAARELPNDRAVMSVDQGKLSANRLSSNVQILLTAGMAKAPLVKEFFEEYHHPTYGARMAKAFQDRYIELRDASPQIHPNQIFEELRIWIGGTKSEHNRLAAVLAVLAYFFESCDIFEPARAAKS